MVYENRFLLVVQVDPDLRVDVGGIESFEKIGCTWGEKYFAET